MTVTEEDIWPWPLATIHTWVHTHTPHTHNEELPASSSTTYQYLINFEKGYTNPSDFFLTKGTYFSRKQPAPSSLDNFAYCQIDLFSKRMKWNLLELTVWLLQVLKGWYIFCYPNYPCPVLPSCSGCFWLTSVVLPLLWCGVWPARLTPNLVLL